MIKKAEENGCEAIIKADKRAVLQKQIDDYNKHGQDSEFYKNPDYLHKLTENCQVLDDDDKVIPGLYSAGSDANTIYADSYNFTLPGNTMGFAVNSGRIAGLEAAKYIAK